MGDEPHVMMHIGPAMEKAIASETKRASMSLLNDLLREVYIPLIRDQLNSDPLMIKAMFKTNNMPRMTLIPWARAFDDWWARSRSRVRRGRLDFADWWRQRPEFLGGGGLDGDW